MPACLFKCLNSKVYKIVLAKFGIQISDSTGSTMNIVCRLRTLGVRNANFLPGFEVNSLPS